MRRASSVRRLFRVLLPLLWMASGHARGQAPAPVDRPPEVWAILVGVDDYTNPAIPDSRTSVRNAQEIRRWIRRAGWDDRHQVLLSDLGSPQPVAQASTASNINLLPSKPNLEWAFREWLFKRASAGDLVVFYFAGRSGCVAGTQGSQLDVRHDLLPKEADPEKPEQTGWSLEGAVDDCVRHKLRVVCWLATEAGDPRPAGPAADWSAGVAWLSRLSRWPGVTAWLASDRPRSGKVGEAGDAFTAALLTALGASGPESKGDRRRNLSACLSDLQQDARLKAQGFCTLGGVPPSMTLWPIEKDAAEPRPELVIQAGHADRVMAMAFPADGRLIVTAAMDSTIRIWSAPDRSLLRVLPGQSVGVTAMAMSRDDRWLISGGGRGAVLVYDRSRDFRLIAMEAGQRHRAGIRQIALLPDGLHFVSLDADGRSFLWDLSRSPLSPQPWLPDSVCKEVACGGRDPGVVAALLDDGTVRMFDAAGGGGPSRKPTRPSTATIAVSPDGRLLATGYDDGKVVIHDFEKGTHREVSAHEDAAPVHRLVFSTAGALAIGHKHGIRLIAGAGMHDTPRRFDLLGRPPEDLIFSPGGEYLAACTQEVGALRVWRIAGDGPSEVIVDDSAQASRLGITGNGRGLAIADFSGGLEFRPFHAQGDEAPWSFPAHRGKVRQLSASPDRKSLLFLDEQRGIRIWDLQERACRIIPGTYRAGAFIDDNRMVVIPDSNAAKHAGRPVLADRSGSRAAAPFFAVETDKFKVPDGIPFERVLVSQDGRRVAAAADAAKEPLVCVWETKGGRLTHWITPDRLEDPVLVLALSGDGRYLLTGGESTVARLWDLSTPPGELVAPVATFADPSVKANVTCAAIRPGHAEQVVTGHSDGEVHGWKWEAGRASGTLDVPRLVAREFATEVKALCFTDDGRYLAASGDGSRIWVGAMDPSPHRIDALDKLRPHHDEQINALIAWRGTLAGKQDRPILVSGSDDTTIRLWDLEGKALRGTFSAANRPAGPAAALNPDLEWVLYTPDGLYDSSAEATKLVQYRRPGASTAPARRDRGPEPAGLAVGLRRQEEAGQLDQLAATHNVYGLGEQLLRGEIPSLKKPEEPPPIAIAAPTRTDPKKPEARLTITLGAADFRDVRLYHNDVPIPSAWDIGKGPRPLSVDVNLTLLPGNNRFYVMAGRDGAYDSCSRVVELDYEAPMKPGQVHVLALGVQNYGRRSLRFAEDDADQLSDLLHDRGIDDERKPGLRRVLKGDDISRENVDQVFREIARRVENRPQDTVVVFLAGHTGVFERQRFCLLLPSYPFSEQEPIQVASRDAAIKEDDQIDDRFVLPYSAIEVNLARIKALNRLIIVDACQADSILDDPRVRAIRKWMELSSRRARTSYLMAARRGEPAREVGPLAHGLFTYALLRGMRAVELVKEPREVSKLALPPDADFNRDGYVSTDEIDTYARQVLPRLSGVFPMLAAGLREGVAPRGEPKGKAPKAEALDQSLRLQGNEASFPLVPIGP
ncbi:MAG: caspase family protein [Isosphaeraceae bacterium]